EMEIALGGGGRYDGLIKLFGGEPTPAVGVALGTNRLVLAIERQQVNIKISDKKRVTIISVDERLKARAFALSSKLRMARIPAEVEVMGRTVSKSLADADRRGFTHAVIIGPKELKEGKVVLRDMRKREQRVIRMEDISEEI
ncbi:MAG: His/Gly/Thr/Pro-type tRNA ligase C-terminal domain-containing protein, partial [Candidatus Ranarchaeia archaeon]